MFRFYNTRVGTVAHLPSDQCIRASLETYGEWAHLELSLLRLLLGRGDTVFDVGANVGYHTMAFARFVGPFGHVVAFEPNPGAFRLANLTVAINDVQNVDLHQALVGSTAGSATVELVEVDGNLGAARFNQPAGGSRRNLVNVNSVRLDDFAHLAPDLVKIDVEGMQFDVLEGAQSLIAAARPMVFLEANEAGDVERAAKIFDAKHYRLVTFSAPAFNPANLCGATHDIFGGTAERGLLALPVERLEKLRRKHSALASLIEGGGDQLDWEAFSTLRDWGALRPWPEVHAMNEALLPTIRRTETKLPEDHPRIFVHIPKTAGTSLTESIKPI
ncbi:MAG: FkbM family methyltransferase, partial [Paracoccaceae bacterium]|nr:FkbM family methyltransferase [Paracoccaceae bacterium]